MEIFFILMNASIIAAGLAFIPAYIARNKGYNFGLWWLYGWLLFIVAIIHVNFIPDLNSSPSSGTSASSSLPSAGVSAAEELKKYKELLDDGIITEDEFTAKKEQLLKLM